MRILHTSDWHLGRTFGPLSLEADQRAFLGWLVEEVRERSVDLVVVAGDIYDRAIAPNESLVLFRDTLQGLLGAGAVVVAITGNHDGADRVSPYDTLIDASGAYVRGGYARPGEVITLEFPDGPLDVVPIPYLEPQLAPDGFDAPDATTGTETIGTETTGTETTGTETTGDAGSAEVLDPGVADPAAEVVARRRRRTHRSVLARAVELARPRLTVPRSIVVAHAFVTGGAESDSERRLTVGGTGEVDAGLFDGFSYVALGHLHRPQRVGAAHVRYSGTPLAYSFSETHPKSVTLVDLEPDGTAEVTALPVPVGRGVRTITGTIDELCGTAPDSRAVASFVRAVLTDPGVVLDAKARLAGVYPHVVEIELQPGGRPPGEVHPAVDVRALRPLDAARGFWADVSGAEPTPAEDRLLADALHHAGAEVAR